VDALNIGLAQLNPTVGALQANSQKILEFGRKADRAGVDVLVFPELALSGYPPEDLLLKRHFVGDCEARLQELAGQLPPDLVTVVGCPLPVEGKAYNAAAVIQDGRVLGAYHKILLPNYGVFDEKRVFAEGDRPVILEMDGIRLGLHICEDSWYPEGKPIQSLAGAGLHALLNLSSSPYHRAKLNLREEILQRAAAALRAPVFYCNLVGGQDELVFDGASLVVSADGGVRARGRQFEEDLITCALPDPAPAVAAPGETLVARRIAARRRARGAKPVPPAAPPAPLDDLAEVYAALSLGLADYVNKNRFDKVVVGLSGGVDSALVAVLAADSLGADRVVGVTMPSVFSSTETLNDARELAARLQLSLYTVPIRNLHDAYLKELRPLWPDRGPDVTEENLQARIRGNIIMALSNKFGWLALTTGNKSEIATGYCTLYGDMAGGFAVLKDVPKMLVFDLARWRNRAGTPPVIPPSIIGRPPTAELRPNQKDSDTLPPYEILDPILERYVEQDQSVEEMARAGFDVAIVRRVIRMVDANEYKRRQGAPGVKITPKAFGRDRRLPITNQYSAPDPETSP
jgi:NAD+ synthase (glutamine-hydrolysing)